MAQPAALPEFRGNVLAVETSPFWDERLAAIADKQEDVRQMARMLRTKNKNGPNKDGAMNDQQQKEYVEKYSNEIISPEELSLWKRGASNAGYHYLGCGKTFVGIGNAFAEALANLQKKTEEIDKADQ
jgi:alpha-galactosidase